MIVTCFLHWLNLKKGDVAGPNDMIYGNTRVISRFNGIVSAEKLYLNLFIL